MFCPDGAGHLSGRRMLSDQSLVLEKVVLRQAWSPENQPVHCAIQCFAGGDRWWVSPGVRQTSTERSV